MEESCIQSSRLPGACTLQSLCCTFVTRHCPNKRQVDGVNCDGTYLSTFNDGMLLHMVGSLGSTSHFHSRAKEVRGSGWRRQQDLSLRSSADRCAKWYVCTAVDMKSQQPGRVSPTSLATLPALQQAPNPIKVSEIHVLFLYDSRACPT